MKTEQDLIGCLDKLNKLCRVCLCESNVKSEALTSYWESLYEKVMSCMQIDFLMKDMLPSEICDLCCKELEVADKLRIKCENSNAVLKRVYQQYLVKDEQRQSNQTDETTILEDHLEMCHSDEELQDKTWDVPLEDDKDQVKNVILHVSLEGKVCAEDKQTGANKIKPEMKNSKKEEVVIKTEKEEENSTSVASTIESSVSAKTKLFTCEMCKLRFKCKQSIISHIAKQHNAQKTSNNPFKVSGSGAERRFHCLECPYVAKRKADLLIHFRVHTGDKPYVCDICNRCFAQRSTLAYHKKSHFDTMYCTCQECGKQFKYAEKLKRHMRVHSKELLHCKLCNKGLKSEESLSNHMKRHSQIKNYSCELCGATFVTGTELIQHKHTHGSKKLLHCTQCEFSSVRKCSLELHMRRHRKDKTEQCNECDYMCYTKAELKIHHNRNHAKEQQLYPCPMCDEKFKNGSSVNKHMLRKHGQKFMWGKVADRRKVK